MPEQPFTVSNTFEGAPETVIQGGTVNVHSGPARVVPQEGPLVRTEWIGRERDLGSIDAALEAGAPIIVAGEAGLGKSAVAAMAIDRNRERYPDGQLYIDLDAEEALQALHSILVRLHIDPARIPPNLEGRLSLYRSVTRSPALLVVVDGVRREREAELFRPTSPAAGYMVVSDVPLRGQEYRTIRLAPLAAEDAAEFLRRACPNLPEGVPARLVEAFGAGPADLTALAGLISVRSLSGLLEVQEALGEGSLFTGIYEGLSESAKWLYRLLGAIPNREFERALTGIFTGSRDWTLEGVPGALDELLEARLVIEHRPGWYRIEAEIAGALERPAANAPVPVELFSAAYDSLTWHVRRAQLADAAVMGERLRFAPALPKRITAPAFLGRPQAMEWFRALYPALHDSLLIAARHGWSDLAWALAEALWAYYANTSRDRDAAAVYRAALGVADDPEAVAQLSALLGMCLLGTGDLAEADQVLEQASGVTDDTVLNGVLTEVLGRLRYRQRRYDEAVDLLERSSALMEATGPKAVGVRLRVIAEIHQERGELELAERTWRRAADLFAEAGDTRNLAGARLDAAVLGFRRGDGGALAEIDRLLEDLCEDSLWQTVAETHERVAAVLAERGESRRDRATRALRLFEAHGDLIGADRVRLAFGVSEMDGR